MEELKRVNSDLFREGCRRFYRSRKHMVLSHINNSDSLQVSGDLIQCIDFSQEHRRSLREELPVPPQHN